MLIVTLAGNIGKDAQFKQTQSGTDICSFGVGVTVGYGENKSTVWVDVTKWGKGAQGLANILRKGSRVTVSGELSTREHNGKTYLQCRADHVTIMGTPNSGQSQRRDDDREETTGQVGGGGYDDLSDEIRF
jgi:single-strand DNA-binding protein